MAAAPRGKTVVTPPQAKDPDAELPVVESFGVAKTPKGYVVFSVTVQGTRVLQHEILSSPEPLAHSVERCRSAVVARFLSTNVRA